MPKEIINHEDDAASFSLHWSGAPGAYTAQLGVAIPRKDLEDYVKRLGADDHTVYWYSPPLDRGHIQRLIRSGRRMRDAVFGADE